MDRKFLIFLLVFLACGPTEVEIQAQIDAAVEDALEKETTIRNFLAL